MTDSERLAEEDASGDYGDGDEAGNEYDSGAAGAVCEDGREAVFGTSAARPGNAGGERGGDSKSGGDSEEGRGEFKEFRVDKQVGEGIGKGGSDCGTGDLPRKQPEEAWQ